MEDSANILRPVWTPFFEIWGTVWGWFVIRSNVDSVILSPWVRKTIFQEKIAFVSILVSSDLDY